jgi:hypothetical protein
MKTAKRLMLNKVLSRPDYRCRLSMPYCLRHLRILPEHLGCKHRVRVVRLTFNPQST